MALPPSPLLKKPLAAQPMGMAAPVASPKPMGAPSLPPPPQTAGAAPRASAPTGGGIPISGASNGSPFAGTNFSGVATPTAPAASAPAQAAPSTAPAPAGARLPPAPPQAVPGGMANTAPATGVAGKTVDTPFMAADRNAGKLPGTDNTDVNALLNKEESDIMKQNAAGLAGQLTQADETSAMNNRRSAEMSGMMGEQFGGGGFQASMAQQGLNTQQARMQAVNDNNKQGMELKMTFLQDKLQAAQASQDKEFEAYIRQQIDQTQRDMSQMQYNATLAEQQGQLDSLK